MRCDPGAGRVARFALLLVLVAICGGAVCLPGGRASARERDRDCSDFPNQAAAQHFFDTHGGSRTNDFDNLDGDGDGLVCESLPCPCSQASGASEGPSKGKPAIPAGSRLKAGIKRDVDGDTVVARFADGAEVDVRLIGIDTPEDVKPDYPVECGSRAAARSMRAMVAGRAAVLVTDPTQDRFDRYGRLLAYVMVDGVDVGKRQIRRGWAMTYIYDDNPFRRYGTYASQQIKAKYEGRGVWGRCAGDFHSAS